MSKDMMLVNDIDQTHNIEDKLKKGAIGVNTFIVSTSCPLFEIMSLWVLFQRKILRRSCPSGLTKWRQDASKFWAQIDISI